MGLTGRCGVLLVSMSEHTQEVITTILKQDKQLKLAGVVAHGSATLACMLRDKPDLVLIDMDLPLGLINYLSCMLFALGPFSTVSSPQWPNA